MLTCIKMATNLRSSLPISALISTILLSSLISTPSIATNTSKIDVLDDGQDKHTKERILYIEAKKAFDNKDLQGYQALKAQLTTYPLYPYLSYAELSRLLDIRQQAAKTSKYGVTATSNRDKKAITQFITLHNKSYLGDRLRSKWLDYLAEQKNWQDYKRYYQDSVKKTELKCFHLQAQLYTGEPLDVSAVDQLWLSNRSQPNACNPVFAEWKKQGLLTPQKLWQRYTLAVDKNNTSLAKYVQKSMNSSDSYLADLYLKVHKSPQAVKEVKSRTRKTSPNDIASQRIVDIIEHGLYRYAYRQPEETYQLYKQFKKTYAFTEQASTRLNQRIAKQLISQDNIALASPLLKQMASDDRADQVE